MTKSILNVIFRNRRIYGQDTLSSIDVPRHEGGMCWSTDLLRSQYEILVN